VRSLGRAIFLDVLEVNPKPQLTRAYRNAPHTHAIIEGVPKDFLYIFLGATMQERDYQAKLIKRLHSEFPGIVVFKNDPSYLQGIPDLTLLYSDRWAVLEVKKDRKAARRPNQAFYIDQLNKMSYAAFIYPENEEEIFDELQQTFQPGR